VTTDAPAPPEPGDYPHHLAITTRWKDNDVYGHVNNVEYYSYVDTVINEFLIRRGGLDIHAGEAFGVCAESGCRFLAAVAYPQGVDAGLRVSRLGRSSVTYDVGLFVEGEGTALAQAHFTHVFVDRVTRRPVPIPDGVRAALEEIA
jgi:acyl-CoA thioester hydrolase